MKTTSFWIDAPRDEFARQCMQRFECSFNADVFKVRSDTVSDRPKKAPHVHMPVVPRKQNYAKAAGQRTSVRAMKTATLVN